MISRAGKLICIGLNYSDHAIESGLSPPSSPLAFAKWRSSLVPDATPIRLPEISREVDWEAELAVVIGRPALNVTVDDALSHVAAYTCFNDISARDVQRADGQWTRAKSFDTFGPIGPAFVPAREIADPQDLKIRCSVNDEVMQDGSTSHMIFTVAEVIAHLSQGMTLEEGDIVATGTPAGVGMAKEPKRFLRDGDLVTVEIEGLGVLSNPVVGSRGRND